MPLEEVFKMNNNSQYLHCLIGLECQIMEPEAGEVLADPNDWFIIDVKPSLNSLQDQLVLMFGGEFRFCHLRLARLTKKSQEELIERISLRKRMEHSMLKRGLSL
jgi:hypothetical protein